MRRGRPQTAERRGERVIILSGDEYDKLTGETPSLKSLLIEGPSLIGFFETLADKTR